MCYIRGNQKSHDLHLLCLVVQSFILFCVFVAGWRHALRSEWPFIIIIISTIITKTYTYVNVFEVHIVHIQFPSSQSESW